MLSADTAAFAQGAKVSALSEAIKEQDRDHPRVRERWFMSGRSVRGESAAALRLNAHQQKMLMRARRRAMLKAQNVPLPLSSTSAGWIPLGPVPLASDASGVGVQDYGPVSGRATAVAIDPADSSGNTVFIGGAFGGVWKSTNAGPASTNPSSATWRPVTDGQGSLAVGAIAIQPGNSNPANSVVLVGTGEANSSGDSYYGIGILRSADGGNTWNLIPSADGGSHSLFGLGFTKIAFSTFNTNVAVAAAAASSQGVVNGAMGTSIRGLYASTDGGQTWSLRVPTDGNGQQISPAASAASVIFNPATNYFYAAIRFHGFYSSPDGVSWSRLPNQPGGGLSSTACPTALAGTPACPIYRGEFAVVPGRNEMYVWYVDANEKDQGIWLTKNGGTSWTQISDSGISNCGDPGTNGCGTEQGAYNLELAAVPNGSGTDLYAGAINIFKCSINVNNATCSSNPFINLTHVYGCSDIAKVHPDQHGLALATNPDNSLPNGKALMYFANDGGIYRALDGFALTSGTCGGSNPFDSLNPTLGSMTQFVTFSQHPSDPHTILGGTQDNGSPATSQATSSPSWINVNSGDGGYNAITPSSTSDWFVSNPDVPPQGLEIDHCSLGIGCHTGDFANGAVVTSTQLGNDDGDFYFPYILDPQSDHEVLVGTCRVWRGGPTTSKTAAYTALSNNFDSLSAATCTGNEVNLVRALAAGGPKDSNGLSKVIYASTSGTGTGSSPSKGGAVWVTTNPAGGPAAFKNVTGGINPGHFNISSVAIDNSDATGSTAYVTIMGFHVSHAFKTTNAGQSWTDFTGSGATALPDAPANAVVVDSGGATVYVGTDVGVFASSTSSPSWTEVGPLPGSGSSGFLPNVAVTALKLFSTANSKRLRASTYGRGVWEFILLAGPDYVIKINDTPQSIFPTQSATFHGTLTAVNSYASSVALSCAGATFTCTPAPSPSTPTIAGVPFTVTTGTINSVGNFSFNVHGVGSDANTVTHDTAALVQVVDFAIGAPSPSTVQVAQGNNSQPVQVQISGLGAFSGTVNLSCSSLTAGVGCTFDNASPSVTASSPATVNVTVTTTALTTPVGAATVTISAAVAGAPAAKTKNLPVTVTTSGFSMTLAKSSLNLLDGKTGAFSGTLTAQNAYNSSVNISCMGTTLPSVCTGTSLTPSVGGQAFSVSVANSTPGSFSFQIQAVGTDPASFTQILPVSLIVAENFTVTAASPTQTVSAGSTASYNLSVAPAGNTFGSPVSLSCNVAPAAGANASGPPPTCSVSPSQVTPGGSAAAVTVSASTTAPSASLRRRTIFYAGWLFLPGIAFVFIGVTGDGNRRSKYVAACIGTVTIACLLLVVTGCGGGGSSTGGPPPPKPGTAGTYTIRVAATAGGLAPQTLTLTLNVQ